MIVIQNLLNICTKYCFVFDEKVNKELIYKINTNASITITTFYIRNTSNSDSEMKAAFF